MDIAIKFLALGGWILFLYLGFRRTSRKQINISEKGGGVFYFISFLWAFAALIIYLAIYSGKEEPNLTRTFQEKTSLIWRTYRNEQLWIRSKDGSFLVSELPTTNQGCQNLAWLNPETIALILKTSSGIFQYEETKQFFSLWIAKPEKNTPLTPINSEAIQLLQEVIRKNPEQLGKDFNNFEALVQEYNLENMARILKSDENPSMAGYVAGIIGDLEGQAAIPVLLEALQKKEKQVHLPALNSLAKLSKKFPEIPLMVHQKGFEHQKDVRFRAEIAKLFGASGDARLIQPMIKWLSDEEEPRELRQEILVQLNALTQQKFEYDPLVTRIRRTRQLEIIQTWYNENQEKLLAKYPKIIEKTTEPSKIEPTPTKEEPKETEQTEQPPKNTTEEPKNTASVQDSNIEENIAKIQETVEKSQILKTYHFRFKELFVQAYQMGFKGSYFETKSTTQTKTAIPLLHGIPEIRFQHIKAQVKENLKQELARPYSRIEQQLRFQALATFLKSTLPLEQIVAKEVLEEWSQYENEEGKAFIAKLLQN